MNKHFHLVPSAADARGEAGGPAHPRKDRPVSPPPQERSSVQPITLYRPDVPTMIHDYAYRATPRRKPCGVCESVLGVVITALVFALLALEAHIGGVP